ncbi:beta-1,3-galactosyltransferase 1-like [Ornithodoros turicata]|uniref:beta-1,3-galactosyltransferase 1-like n=1 Tax=Ornithodoros turicata TaxID=34597 RepID=UPI0031393B44
MVALFRSIYTKVLLSAAYIAVAIHIVGQLFRYYTSPPSAAVDLNVAVKVPTFDPPSGTEKEDEIQLPDSFNYTLDNYRLCVRGDPYGGLVLILVSSKSINFRERIAIRGTWGLSSRDHGFVLAFLLGRSEKSGIQDLVLAEDDHYYDIIQGDFPDANATLKTIMMLHWVSVFCPGAKFVLKTNDDVLVNPWGLWSEAYTSLKNSKWTMWGLKYEEVRLPSKASSDALIEDEGEVRGPFLDGSSYLFTADCASLLYSLSISDPSVPVNDAYLTGELALEAGLRVVHHPGFQLSRTLFRPCAVPRQITRRGFDPMALLKVWKTVPIKSKTFRCNITSST